MDMANLLQYQQKIIRKIGYYINKFKYEKTYKQVRYLFIPEDSSNELIVSFSGFTGTTPKYNYVSSLANIKVNKLFILDTFGYMGSYYLMENGSFLPEELTSELIQTVIIEKGIKKWYAIGSSKGGTAAIYFGIKLHANKIYAAACQYYIGSYLNRPEHSRILKSMIGSNDIKQSVEFLNNIIKNILTDYQGEHIVLYYSDAELTFERQIIPLITELKNNSIPFNEVIEHFTDHQEVGIYFSSYLKTVVAKEIGHGK